MSTNLRKKLEKILQLLDRLAIELPKGNLLIVEGKNDLDALNTLGIKGDVISAKSSGKSFLDLLTHIERRKNREVILLLDFDRRGREWTYRLTTNLEKMKIRPNLFFWRKLRRLVGHDVKDIEGLASYVNTLRERAESKGRKI